MAKKFQQSSGPSYSLLALLKRTLFLHETANSDELVEEVHEYMLKDQSYEQIKQRYVEPILHANPSFVEVEKEADIWKLTEGNKVNDAVYDVFLKHQSPLSERQILNRLVKVEQMAGDINISLDLMNDARFSDLEGGKYWILSEWVVVNEYARSILLKVKSGLSEKELLNRVVAEYDIEKDSAVFIPKLDERFVKKEKKWTLKRFIEQKTKLRASRIERLYQYLLAAGTALSADELTTSVLNFPAGTTDVHEKLMADPRFVFENEKWDLRSRVDQRQVAALEPEIEEQPSPVERIPEMPAKFPTIEEVEEQPIRPEEPLITAELPDIESGESDLHKDQGELKEEDELPQEEPAEAVQEPIEKIAKLAEALKEVSEAEEEVEEEVDQMDEYIESLRNKVIEFLQDAFHSEGVVYNADIIDQFVTSDEREALFQQFTLEHFVNPAKERNLTDQNITKLMLYLAEPTLNDKILDPCCGTGGFLLQTLEILDAYLQDAEWTERDFAIQYELRTGQFYFVQMSEEEQEYFDLPLDDAVARWLPIIRFCKQQQLTGVDIDPFAYRTADLNIALQGFPEIVLHQDNSLTSKQIGSGVYDIVIGNPPISGDNPTRFLRRSLVLAKPGGKILLLLPNEMFADFRLVSTSLRNQIVAQSIVKAIIRLPEPLDTGVYGSERTLLYCLRKHHETEQESDVLIGEIEHFDELEELIEVLEDPDIPVSQSDDPISGDVVFHILSSYQRSAYNLLLEGLRRRTLRGNVISIEEWSQVQKVDHAPEEM
jgi:type I restriction-modification system DNA methylase subunit